MDREPRTTVRLLTTLGAAMVVGFGTAALAWWRLGPVTRSTVWAEDGGIFLRDRLALGPVEPLLHPYAGYLHLVPRLLVDLAWAQPVEDYAHVLSAGACLVVGVLAATVFVLAREVVPAWPLRVLLAVVPALVPLAPYEISGNVANLHWFMLFAAPWLFSYRARTWWGSAVVAVLTAFVVLTELQAVLFLPMLLLAWLPPGGASGTRAWPRAVPVTVVALAGGTAQVVAALTDDRTARPGSPAFADVVAGWLLQPFAAVWDPDVVAVVRTVLAHGWAVVLVPAALLVLVVGAALVVGTWRARWTLLALVAASGGVWWAALLANGGAAQPWAHPVAALESVGPQRYAAASGLLLLAGVVVAASVLIGWRERSAPARGRSDEAPVTSVPLRDTGRPGGAVRLVGAVAGWCVVTVVVAALVVNAAPGATRRSEGPVWAAQIPAAVAACRGDASQVVEVRTAPWTAQVPCARLLGH